METAFKAASTAASDNPISTNNWDTVYAIRFPDVNRAIVHQKSSPPNFDITIEDDDMGAMSVSGSFGDWQLTSGGDGKIVWMKVPIPVSKLSYAGKDHAYPDPIGAIIEVNLLWVSSDGKTGGDGAHNLKIKGGNDSVFVRDIDPGKNTMTNTAKDFYKDLLQQWMQSHIDAFEHVFASIEINEQADSGGFEWLKPTDKLYAVVDVDDDFNKSIFGVLCMTGGRKAPGEHEISPFAIPEGVNSGFLIAPERIIGDMILPGIHLLFADATPESIELRNNGLQIINTVDLTFNDQTLDDGKIVKPKVDKEKFKVTIESTYVKLEFEDLYFDWSPGISVHVTHTAIAKLSMTSERKLKLDMIKSTTDGMIKTETWVMIAEIVGSIAGSILGSVGGGFLGGAAAAGGDAVTTSTTEATIETITTTVEESTENMVSNITKDVAKEAATEMTGLLGKVGSAAGRFASFFARNWPKILGSMIGGAVGATIGGIPTIIEAVANDQENIPTLDQLGTQALSPLTWPNLEDKGFTLVSGELNDAFRIGINLNFKS